jgi:CRISPR-associated endonuclease/helicase Cas3
MNRENPFAKENLEILNLTPPLSTEAAAIPLMQARKWLVIPADTPAKEISSDNSSDTPALPIAEPRETKVAHPAWIFRESEADRLKNARDLRPGDTLILPVESPNLERLISLPVHEPISHSKDEEPNLVFLDQYERAHLTARDALSLRLDKETLQGLLAALPDNERLKFQALIPAQGDSDENEIFPKKEWENSAPKILSILTDHLGPEHPWSALWQKKDLRKNIPQEGWRALSHPSGGAILSNRTRIGFTAWPLEPESLLGQGQYIGTEVRLEDHVAGVTHRAETNAASAPCSPAIAEAIRLAAKWHDIGKLDPRFQAWLHGIAPDFIFNKPAIAKSVGIRAMAENQQLRGRARVPDGFRHEFLSTLIAASSETVQSQPERDLILHLIATHHGHARAMAKPVLDDEPEDFDATIEGETIAYQGRSAPLASFADGAPARFWSLTRRFGWWGLPYLESILRLADQRQSAAEAQGTNSNSSNANKAIS